MSPDRKSLTGWASVRAGLALLNRRERRLAVVWAIAITIAELLQLASIALLLPLIGLMVEPELAQKSMALVWLMGVIGSVSSESLVLMLGMACFVLILAGQGAGF